jgi:serine/threonine protein kinase
MAMQLGDVVGDYQVTGVLGRGGMGKVFRVRSLLTDREEAMKVLLPGFDDNPELDDRFLREIKVHARLQHPNIAALRTALRVGERLYMLVELVEGSSLAEKLRDGPLPVSLSVDWMTQVLSALAYAHECGVIHRDIKPANILIADNGAVKLTDFGIARAEDAARLTSTGHAVGTLAYMSPEQVRADPVDARSDLYSLGLTLYEMVTGRRAIQGETAHSLMNAQLMTMPVEPTELNPGVPTWLSVVIMRALAKEPDKRFQTAEEFKNALTDVTREVTPLPANVQPTTVLAPTVLQTTPYQHTPLPTHAPLPTKAPLPTHAPSQTKAPSSTTPYSTTRSVTSGPTSGTASTSGSHPSAFEPAVLDRLTQTLAPYLGPIAKVLVNRAARRVGSLKELHETLAAEIPSDDDRRRFLAKVRSAF